MEMPDGLDVKETLALMLSLPDRPCMPCPPLILSFPVLVLHLHPGVLSRVRPWMAAARLLCPWDSPERTGVGCHALLQGIFPTRDGLASLVPPAFTGGFFTAGAPWETLGTL